MPLVLSYWPLAVLGNIKSTPKIEKAASETRKRLELSEARLKGVTFNFFLKQAENRREAQGPPELRPPLLP